MIFVDGTFRLVFFSARDKVSAWFDRNDTGMKKTTRWPDRQFQ